MRIIVVVLYLFIRIVYYIYFQVYENLVHTLKKFLVLIL